MNIKIYSFLYLGLVFLTGCQILNEKNNNRKHINQIQYTSNVFEYKEASLSDVKIDNVIFNDKNGVPLALLPKVSALLSNPTDSTRLECVVNINMKNTKSDQVTLRKFTYSLLLNSKVLANETVEDSISILAYHSSRYVFPIDAYLRTYIESFEDEKLGSDALKSFLHLNKQSIRTSLQIDSIEYEINGVKYLDLEGEKIEF